MRIVPDDRPARSGQRFDVAGATALFGALSTLLLGVSEGRYWGWGSPPILGLFGASALSFAIFVRIELGAAQPMLPLDVFRNRLFAAASASSLITFCAASQTQFMLPFFLVAGLGLTQSGAGVLLVPSMLMMFVSAPISGALSDKYGSRVLSPLGIAICAIALFQLGQLSADSGPFDIVWRIGLLGLGLGTFGSPNNSAMMGSVSRDRVGLAGGTMSAMRNLGNVTGVAIAGTVLTSRQATHTLELAASGIIEPLLGSRALIAGVQDAFMVAAAIATVGVVVALVRGPASARVHVAATPESAAP